MTGQVTKTLKQALSWVFYGWGKLIYPPIFSSLYSWRDYKHMLGILLASCLSASILCTKFLCVLGFLQHYLEFLGFSLQPAALMGFCFNNTVEPTTCKPQRLATGISFLLNLHMRGCWFRCTVFAPGRGSSSVRPRLEQGSSPAAGVRFRWRAGGPVGLPCFQKLLLTAGVESLHAIDQIKSVAKPMTDGEPDPSTMEDEKKIFKHNL